jgi:hypothetical protein
MLPEWNMHARPGEGVLSVLAGLSLRFGTCRCLSSSMGLWALRCGFDGGEPALSLLVWSHGRLDGYILLLESLTG